MRRFLAGVRLFLAVQYRSGFVPIYMGLAVFTILFLRTFVPESWWPMLVPALLLGEYGTTSVFMVAAQSFLSRGERSDEALAVTPLTAATRTVALVTASAGLAMVSGALVFAATLGLDGRVALLALPLFATAAVSGTTGLILSSRYEEFTRFLLGAIPVVTVFMLPLLSYFELTPRYTFAWLPWDAALFSFQNLARPAPSFTTYVVLALELVAFTGLGLYGAARAEAGA